MPSVGMDNAHVKMDPTTLSTTTPASRVQVSQFSFLFYSSSSSPFLSNCEISVNLEIGDYCRLTSNCAAESTTCVKGECRCPLDHHTNWERNRCLRNAELDETCTHHDECVVENSICYRTCKCRTSHVTSQDGKRCLPLATTLYQKCYEDLQCSQVPYTYCGSNNTCICLPDHHDINSVRIADDSFKDERFLNVQLSLNFFQRCHVSVRLDGTCEDDLNCVMGHSSCVNRRCTCDDGFEEFRGKFCSSADKVQISFVVLLALSLSCVRLL